jgi:nicotinate-nucleotide pyrophosphorylase (carboxylating)
VELTAGQIEQVVRVALAEDLGSGDLTTDAVVPVGARCRALHLLAEPGVVCGIPVAAAVFPCARPGRAGRAARSGGRAAARGAWCACGDRGTDAGDPER